MLRQPVVGRGIFQHCPGCFTARVLHHDRHGDFTLRDAQSRISDGVIEALGSGA